MPIKKLSFEESLECPLTEDEMETMKEWDESESYYGSALTDYQRNRQSLLNQHFKLYLAY